MVIDPPFGFHWGDSAAHVEALLAYSSAEIVMRTATGLGETWRVEGLIQPGLKNALFTFEKNALTAVRLECQYDGWTSDQYRTRMEELRAFFDNLYGEKQRTVPKAGKDRSREDNNYSFVWHRANTNLALFRRSESAPVGKRLVVTDLIIQYDVAQPGSPSDVPGTERWNDTIVSPVVARKLQTSDRPPADSDLWITSARLLNTSTDDETAHNLQLAVKLQPDALPDPTKAVVTVNFYDVLPNSEIVLTDAQVTYDWQSRRDWKEANPELLGVTYVRKTTSSPPKGGSRRLFGYVAMVYYDGRLESVRAEPTMLINLFPVRTFVSPFESAQAAAARGDFPAAARLYRTAAEKGNLFALENLAWFYARGKGVAKDYRQAAVAYERAALQNTPRALNALAWFLATCEDDSIRNGAEAVRTATKACELSYWQEWKYIDTLAAAWAENGDFKRAIEYVQLALQGNGVDENARKKMEDRIALYRKRQPVRE